MALLTANSEAAGQILRALNLPEDTIAFTLRMRAGEIATLDIETYAQQEGVTELTTVLKRYKLEEIKEPDKLDNRHEASALNPADMYQ